MKVSINNSTMSIISNYDLATLQKVAKFRPEALILYKGEGNHKEEVYRIAPGSKGSITQFGLTFADETKVGPAKAVISEVIPASVERGAEAVKAYIREKIGLDVVYGKQIEAQIEAAMGEIAADETAMNEAIEIADEAPEAETEAAE